LNFPEIKKQNLSGALLILLEDLKGEILLVC